jgi:hypothetical protein
MTEEDEFTELMRLAAKALEDRPLPAELDPEDGA